MLLKLLPGFLAGQWAALLSGMLLADPFSEQQGAWSANWIYLLPWGIFMIFSATAKTVRKAWGRSLLGAGILCWLMAVRAASSLAWLVGMASVESDPTGKVEEAGSAAIAIGSVGSGFMSVFWFLLGICLVLFGMYLMFKGTYPKKSKMQEQNLR